MEVARTLRLFHDLRHVISEQIILQQQRTHRTNNDLLGMQNMQMQRFAFCPKAPETYSIKRYITVRENDLPEHSSIFL